MFFVFVSKHCIFPHLNSLSYSHCNAPKGLTAAKHLFCWAKQNTGLQLEFRMRGKKLSYALVLATTFQWWNMWQNIGMICPEPWLFLNKVSHLPFYPALFLLFNWCCDSADTLENPEIIPSFTWSELIPEPQLDFEWTKSTQNSPMRWRSILVTNIAFEDLDDIQDLKMICLVFTESHRKFLCWRTSSNCSLCWLSRGGLSELCDILSCWAGKTW